MTRPRLPLALTAKAVAAAMMTFAASACAQQPPAPVGYGAGQSVQPSGQAVRPAVDPNAPFSFQMGPIYDPGEAPARPALQPAPVYAPQPAAPAYIAPAPAPAYPAPGYAAPQPGYPQPTPPQPGYVQPGYAQPTYAQPGYVQPGYPQPVAQTPFRTDQPAPIAILLPTSDSRAGVRRLAESLANAAKLAAEDIGDRNVVLTAYDDGGDPAKAAAAARQAMDDGARLILGPLFSANTQAVRRETAPRGISVISFSTDAGVLGQGVWSIGFLPETETRRILTYAAQRGLASLALFTPQTPYGAVVRAAAQRAATDARIQILDSQNFAQDFQAIEAQAKSFGAQYSRNPQLQGVMLAAGGQTLQALASFLAYNDVLPSKVKFLGPGSWEEDDVFREATLRGGWFAAPDPELRKAFETRYESAYGVKPDPLARLAYDAVATAAALLEDARRTGDSSPFDAQDIMDPNGFSGVTGVYRFLPDGRNERGLAVLEVGRREFTVVDPAPRTFVPGSAGFAGAPPR
ncbi:ABC transporter substrate-binding protein [Neomegalonema sp.]|uniref:penicillin-binding protein activator n=1 Tax=Neomegalonema sp. TaxID=2039713 RepID=UPI00262090DE|nr:ABC transporter substrate-binding protein [Neomegalonema sp.]MDD2867180.1 ABC transporter substrate-binding protein [Neomegalonema sp.]